MRSRALIVLSALTLSLLLPGTVGARSATAAAKAEHDRIVAYWTPARIAAATPRDYVRNSAGKLVPNAKPGGGGGSGAVTGASWTLNGAIEQRSGRILFSTIAGNWICSGSVVNDGTGNGRSSILTAGHCVYDGAEGWSFNLMYIPDFDDAATYTCPQTIHGCWTATRLAANTAFVSGGGFGNDTVGVDYGFARVGLGGKSGSAELDAVTGGYNLRTANVPALSATQWAFGYPAEGRYRGKDLIYCKGTTIVDPYGADTTGIGCNMNGGSSGGPRLSDTTAPADGSGQLASVNSYGYSGLTYMFGPKFNSLTATVWGDVLDGSATNGTTTFNN